MRNNNLEFNDETRERLDRYVEERGAFPLHLTCETYDNLINGLLDKIERLEDKCERTEEQADLDREVLFDAVLIGMQKVRQRPDIDMSVSTLKAHLIQNITKACISNGNNDEMRRLHALAEEHNKTRRYDNPVFKDYDKLRR